MTNDDRPATQERRSTGVVVALIPDVFFSVTVRNAVRGLGYDAVIVSSIEELVTSASAAGVVLAIVDMSAVRDDAGWSAAGALNSSGVPVLVFGPHKDVDSFRSAQRAGVARVVANSQLHREMGDLIARYARSHSGMESGESE